MEGGGGGGAGGAKEEGVAAYPKLGPSPAPAPPTTQAAAGPGGAEDGEARRAEAAAAAGRRLWLVRGPGAALFLLGLVLLLTGPGACTVRYPLLKWDTCEEWLYDKHGPDATQRPGQPEPGSATRGCTGPELLSWEDEAYKDAEMGFPNYAVRSRDMEEFGSRTEECTGSLRPMSHSSPNANLVYSMVLAGAVLCGLAGVGQVWSVAQGALSPASQARCSLICAAFLKGLFTAAAVVPTALAVAPQSYARQAGGVGGWRWGDYTWDYNQASKIRVWLVVGWVAAAVFLGLAAVAALAELVLLSRIPSVDQRGCCHCCCPGPRHYGTPYAGQPYGQAYGQPYGQPNRLPYGSPYSQPYAKASGAMGQPGLPTAPATPCVHCPVHCPSTHAPVHSASSSSDKPRSKEHRRKKPRSKEPRGATKEGTKEGTETRESGDGATLASATLDCPTQH